MSNCDQIVKDILENGYHTNSISSGLVNYLSKISNQYIKKEESLTTKSESKYTPFRLILKKNSTYKSSFLKKLRIKILKFYSQINYYILIFMILMKIRKEFNIFKIIFLLKRGLQGKLKSINIDAYRSMPSNKQIISWHRDGHISEQRFSNKKNIEYLKKFRTKSIKFFFFLDPKLKGRDIISTKRSLAIIPKTSEISHFIDDLVVEKLIPYSKNHFLEELISSVNYVLENKEVNNLQIKNGLINYLKKIQNCTRNQDDTKDYDLPGAPSDLIIFDDKSIHRGAPTGKCERLVFRIILNFEMKKSKNIYI